MSLAVLTTNTPLRTDFLHAAGSIVFNDAQRRRIARFVTMQVSIGGPGEKRPATNFDNTVIPSRPAAFEAFDAREFNKVLHYLRIQMAISRWGNLRPRDWFDRTGLHFKQKQRAVTRAYLASLYRRVFS